MRRPELLGAFLTYYDDRFREVWREIARCISVFGMGFQKNIYSPFTQKTSLSKQSGVFLEWTDYIATHFGGGVLSAEGADEEVVFGDVGRQQAGGDVEHDGDIEARVAAEAGPGVTAATFAARARLVPLPVPHPQHRTLPRRVILRPAGKRRTHLQKQNKKTHVMIRSSLTPLSLHKHKYFMDKTIHIFSRSMIIVL